MSDIVVEKFSKQMMSAYGYDFKILYFPESDNCMVPYKATPDAPAYICMLQKIKIFYQNQVVLSLLI